jgi:hypothetical protein
MGAVTGSDAPRRSQLPPGDQPGGSATAMEGQMMWCNCREPSLNEIMQDPIIKALMRRDAVRETELRRLMARVGAAYDFSAVIAPSASVN